MKHVGTKTIETTRMTLRRLELTDTEMMFSNWTGNDKVTCPQNMISKVN